MAGFSESSAARMVQYCDNCAGPLRHATVTTNTTRVRPRINRISRTFRQIARKIVKRKPNRKRITCFIFISIFYYFPRRVLYTYIYIYITPEINFEFLLSFRTKAPRPANASSAGPRKLDNATKKKIQSLYRRKTHVPALSSGISRRDISLATTIFHQ